MRGVASITTVPTWPHGHSFAILDALAVESLRADADGVPAYLAVASHNAVDASR